MSEENDPRDQEPPVDPLVQLRAQLDQVAALAPEVARTAWRWFTVFQEEGFNANQALWLTAVELMQDPGSPA